MINPLGMKGLREIGIVGVAAAVANAVYHATGAGARGSRSTLDKLLDARRSALRGPEAVRRRRRSADLRRAELAEGAISFSTSSNSVRRSTCDAE